MFVSSRAEPPGTAAKETRSAPACSRAATAEPLEAPRSGWACNRVALAESLVTLAAPRSTPDCSRARPAVALAAAEAPRSVVCSRPATTEAVAAAVEATAAAEAPQSALACNRTTPTAATAARAASVALCVPHPLGGDPLRGHLFSFWWFMGQALLGSQAEDAICRGFELGGSIDCLGDVAFVRDEIVAPALTAGGDLHSIVWHCLLVAWTGAGGPQQETYRWLRDEGLARRYRDTDAELVTRLYQSVQRRVDERGAGAVFHGDSRAVKWRLHEQRQGLAVLAAWYEAVPRIAGALADNISPEKFERVLREVHFIGELTAKEIFVLLYYARPQVADTTRHVPVGPGARAGARLVLGAAAYLDPAAPAAPAQPTVLAAPAAAAPAAVAAEGRGDGWPAPAPGSMGQASPPAASPPSAASRRAPSAGPLRGRRCSLATPQRKRRKLVGGINSSVGAASIGVREGNEAVKVITRSRDWALQHVPGLAAACESYKRNAPHRHDPSRNCRVAREHLIDHADVEVMLCYYQNYHKMRVRSGVSCVPAAGGPRGWMRRTSVA